MNKAIPIAAVILIAAAGLSTYLLFYAPSSSSTSGLGGPGTGTLNIYLTDARHSNATLRFLLVKVTSVTLKYSSGESNSTTTSTTSTASSTSGTTSSTSNTVTSTANRTENRFVYNVPSSVGTNVNVTSLHGSGILLGAPKVPAGNVTGVILQITGAKAYWSDGNSTRLEVVANGKLMIPIQFTVQAGGATTLTLDIVSSDIHVSVGNMRVLTPVIHATVVQSNGTTVSAQVSETETETTVTTTTTTATASTASTSST